MKNNMKTPKLLLALLALFGYNQCAEDHHVTLKESQIRMLTSNVWIPALVENSSDGDLTFQYTDFAIAFIKSDKQGFDGDYYLSGGGNAFKELFGKWRFNDDLTKLVLQNGREMDLELSSNALTLSFYQAPVNGRVQGLSGVFTFHLKKR
jgi:hypothetical protein